MTDNSETKWEYHLEMKKTFRESLALPSFTERKVLSRSWESKDGSL